MTLSSPAEPPGWTINLVRCGDERMSERASGDRDNRGVSADGTAWCGVVAAVVAGAEGIVVVVGVVWRSLCLCQR
jgi:hypothetical protein